MSLIPNKREFLARGMRQVGLIRLIERLARRPSILVLTYHRIGDPASRPYYAPITSANAVAFKSQVRTLRDTHRVVTLDEFKTIANTGFRVTEPTALVTFDDGYRDNVLVALPILRTLNVAATFFLTTGFLQSPRLPWWDHLAYVINQSQLPELRLDRPEPMTIALSPGPRTEAIGRVVRAWLDHHIDDDPTYRAHLEDRTEVSTEGVGRDLFMTWDQARGLLAAGMTVGSHTQSHPNLAKLTADEKGAELAGSKTILETELRVPIDTLAYPYGWPGTFDSSTVQVARESGYGLAFSSIEGANRPAETGPMAIRRLGVGFADSPVLLRARLALYASLGRSLV